MLPKVLKEYSAIQDEIFLIAKNLVIARRNADYRRKLAKASAKDKEFIYEPLSCYIDEVEIQHEEEDLPIIIKCTEFGSKGYVDGFTENASIEEFCDPMLLLDPEGYQDMLVKDGYFLKFR